jgi:hypothetical protein
MKEENEVTTCSILMFGYIQYISLATFYVYIERGGGGG